MYQLSTCNSTADTVPAALSYDGVQQHLHLLSHKIASATDQSPAPLGHADPEADQSVPSDSIIQIQNKW